MLKIKVKVGNVTNLSDARYCAGMGVDMLGFPVGVDHDAIDPEKYKQITGWVSVPEFVIEWSSAQLPATFKEIISQYNAGLVEIDVIHLDKIPSITPRLIVRMDAIEWQRLRPVLQTHRARIAYLLLNGTGTPDPSHITRIGGEFPLLLGFGVTPISLGSLISLPIAGIALTGSEETKPGLKDYQQLSEILESLEI